MFLILELLFEGKGVNLNDFELIEDFKSDYFLMAKRGKTFVILIQNIKSLEKLPIAKSIYFNEIIRNWNTLINKLEPRLTPQTSKIQFEKLTTFLMNLEVMNSLIAKLKYSFPNEKNQKILFGKSENKEIDDTITNLIHEFKTNKIIHDNSRCFSHFIEWPTTTYQEDSVEIVLPFSKKIITTKVPIYIPSNFCSITFKASGVNKKETIITGYAYVIILKASDDFLENGSISSVITCEPFDTSIFNDIKIPIHESRGNLLLLLFYFNYSGELRMGEQSEFLKDCKIILNNFKFNELIQEQMKNQFFQSLKKLELIDTLFRF